MRKEVQLFFGDLCIYGYIYGSFINPSSFLFFNPTKASLQAPTPTPATILASWSECFFLFQSQHLPQFFLASIKTAPSPQARTLHGSQVQGMKLIYLPEKQLIFTFRPMIHLSLSGNKMCILVKIFLEAIPLPLQIPKSENSGIMIKQHQGRPVGPMSGPNVLLYDYLTLSRQAQGGLPQCIYLGRC